MCGRSKTCWWNRSSTWASKATSSNGPKRCRPRSRSSSLPTRIHPALGGLPVSYWLDLKDYDPAAAAKKLGIPMLILQGERDYQVTMTDFALWKAAVGNSKGVVMKSYPALNHLFVAGEGKSMPAEYAKPGHVAPAVIDDIAKFIK